MTDFCIPFGEKEYYFEILIEKDGNKDKGGFIAIGFSIFISSPISLPGWSDDNIGYHGDDGHIRVLGFGTPYAGCFGEGDTIGCSVNLEDNAAYFAKNSRCLGVSCRDIKGQIYPCVGLISPGTRVVARFGLPPLKKPENQDPKELVTIRSLNESRDKIAIDALKKIYAEKSKFTAITEPAHDDITEAETQTPIAPEVYTPALPEIAIIPQPEPTKTEHSKISGSGVTPDANSFCMPAKTVLPSRKARKRKRLLRIFCFGNMSRK